MPELKLGYQGPLYVPWYDWAKKYASTYAFLLGSRDGYYGSDEARFTTEMQRRLGIVQDGKFGDRTAARAGYKWPGATAPPVVEVRRPIWLYSAPGSGAPWNVGPSFDLGNRAQDVLHINHQPIGYPIGGYLGLMGGDPTYSYNDVIGFEGAELERLLSINPDVIEALRLRQSNPRAAVPLELWFSGYSQSADGLEDALVRLFGDGGRFAVLRDRINGVIQFGNPSTRGTGIARKVRPEWLYTLVHNVNYDNDFYAVATDEIRPAFYAIIIEADTELPFFVHVLKVAMGVILNTVPIFGGLLGPLAAPLLAGMTGLNGMLPLLTGLMGTANSTADEAVDKKLTDMLSATGLIKNIPGLIALVGALPGLQAHGGYASDPVMMQRAYDVIAGFRR
jgi:hypothetical protein